MTLYSAFFGHCSQKVLITQQKNVIWRVTNSESHAHSLKGIVHHKMKVLSSITWPHVLPNMYDFQKKMENKTKNPSCFFPYNKSDHICPLSLHGQKQIAQLLHISFYVWRKKERKRVSKMMRVYFNTYLIVCTNMTIVVFYLVSSLLLFSALLQLFSQCSCCQRAVLFQLLP